MERSSQPEAAEQGGEPPVKRCRVEAEPSVIDLTGAGSSQEEVQEQGRPSGPAGQPGQLLESQRLLAKAAELRKQVAEGQAAREAAAAAAEARRLAATASVERAAPHVMAAELRARKDAQAALESARSSIEAAAAAITASAEQQAALSRALGQDSGAVQRQLERACAAAAAAAAVAKARLESEVQEAIKTARARAEVAYGMVKAQREAAAAEAAAEAASAGWPAERCRLLEEAGRLEQQAVPVAELEAQRSSALVQALATAGCLPLIAGCLGDTADKLHFALSCKALLRQYRQEQVAWMRGLHVSLACSGSEAGVAACSERLLRLLQCLPPGSIASLSLVQLDGYNHEVAMMGIASLCQGLEVLDIQLQPNYVSLQTQLDFSLLRCASLEGTSSACSTFSLQAPCLLDLTLTRCKLAGQLPQLLTQLNLREVQIHEVVAPSLFSATRLCSLQLSRVHLEAFQDWKQLTAMGALTNLCLAYVTSAAENAQGVLCRQDIHDYLSTVLAALPSLQRLALSDAGGGDLAGLAAPVSYLVLSMRCFSRGGANVARIAQLTALHTLVCTGCYGPDLDQLRALTHIQNLICH